MRGCGALGACPNSIKIKAVLRYITIITFRLKKKKIIKYINVRVII